MRYMTPWILTLSVSVAVSSADTCEGRCDAALDNSQSCQCNSACERYGDCCSDYAPICKGETCNGRCFTSADHSKPCQCNALCLAYNDCCSDYQSLCEDGGVVNPGEGSSGGVGNPTPCDLSCVADQLWNNDVNRPELWDYQIEFQGRASDNNVDAAPYPLMTINENNVFSKPTFQAFLPLLDNYKTWIGELETLTSSQWNEINHFLDVIMQTSVMDLTYKFLLDNGKVANMADFRDTIKELWFNLYSRSSSGPASGDSSGFEHVIVGELKPDKVSGFHNWVQFYMEEKAGRLNYKGYKTIAEPNMVAALFDWQGKTKSKGSFFYGVSPEFDIAIYSICALMHPSSPCIFNMNGQNVKIQTYDVSHKSGLQVATAYPDI